MKKINLETIVYFLAMALFFKSAFDHKETFFFEGLFFVLAGVSSGYFLYIKIKN